MWIRRIWKKAITVWVMRPILRDKAGARLSAATARATRGVVRKMVLVAAGVGLTVVAVVAGHPRIAIVPALLTLCPLCAYAVARTRRTRRVWRISRSGWSTEGLTPARQMLCELGIDDQTADRLMAASQGAEVRIAVFDQNNRIRSEVGPIPLFAEQVVTAEEFRARARHGLELVVTGGVVCVKKTYGDRASFEREVLALDALKGLVGVPRLLAVRQRPRIAYQSFVAGQNVGSLMVAHGASVTVQYRVGSSFERADRWDAEVMAAARDVALRALEASVGPDVIPKAADLMNRIHERGVTIGDVKYGNLLVLDGEPYLCDFDGATVHKRDSWGCVQARASDREKFNYFFNANTLTERDFRTTVAALAREKPDLFYAPIYYGHGYETEAPGSIELGSGKWQFIRPYLPDLKGKSIVDLGCNNALLPLEMLRAGARRVTAYELNPVLARYARLNHQWFEFVDNRRYPEFQLVEGYMHNACTRDWSGYDIATAFCSLYYEDPEDMARIVRAFSATTEWFIAQANESRAEHDGVLRERASLRFLRDVLRDNGYPEQTIVAFPYYDRPIVIGHRVR